MNLTVEGFGAMLSAESLSSRTGRALLLAASLSERGEPSPHGVPPTIHLPLKNDFKTLRFPEQRAAVLIADVKHGIIIPVLTIQQRLPTIESLSDSQCTLHIH